MSLLFPSGQCRSDLVVCCGWPPTLLVQSRSRYRSICWFQTSSVEYQRTNCAIIEYSSLRGSFRILSGSLANSLNINPSTFLGTELPSQILGTVYTSDTILLYIMVTSCTKSSNVWNGIKQKGQSSWFFSSGLPGTNQLVNPGWVSNTARFHYRPEADQIHFLTMFVSNSEDHRANLEGEI